MRKFFAIILLILCHSIYCQEYQFDYMSTYDYRLNEKDKAVEKFIFLANSKTEDYLLRVLIKNDSIKYSSLIDFSKNMEYQIGNFKLDIESINNIEIVKIKPLKVEHCDDYTNKYNVEYVNINGVDVIKIKRYKNKRKTKLINECVLYTKKSDIKNQYYSFPPLIFPLHCDKFKLETDKIITEGNFLEDDKEFHFYKLIDIKQVDLKIKI